MAESEYERELEGELKNAEKLIAAKQSPTKGTQGK